MKNPKVKLVLALVAMFVLGAISGMGLSFFYHPHFFRPPRHGEMQAHLLNFLTDRLHLTSAQQEQIKPITVDFGNQIEALHAQSVTQFAQLADATDQRIAQFLTPEQKLELDKLGKERAQDFQRHGGPPDGGPHGGGPPGP
jgi:Spy/CpxP family protein refolding chaperone